MKGSRSGQLPERVKRLFWDVEKEEVDPELHRSFVIARIMDYGDMEDVKWMLETFSREEMIKVVKRRRGLSRKSAIFWSVYFGIPREDIECLKMPYHQKQRT